MSRDLAHGTIVATPPGVHAHGNSAGQTPEFWRFVIVGCKHPPRAHALLREAEACAARLLSGAAK